jgi:hypothetical protein
MAAPEAFPRISINNACDASIRRWFATGELCLYLSSLSAAATLVSALPFGHMNLTPRQASSWFWPMRFQISAFAGFHSS